MSIAEHAPAHIRAISPYQPGRPIEEVAREQGLSPDAIIKLASNENPLGMSEAAREAIFRTVTDSTRYPDGNGFALKTALCRRYGVQMENLILGNGSNDLLEIAADAFLTPGAATVYSQYSFAVYALATQAAGATGIVVPAQNYGHDLDAMLAAIDANTRIVFLANPNNPTGTFLPGAALEQFIAHVPRDVLVILDEAYTEYLADEQRYDSIGWLARFEHLLVLRTFSKAYGLAGLRVGYGIGAPAVIDLMNRVRQPFNVSTIALAAAEAALGDTAFLRASAELNRRGMAQYTQAFARLGLRWLPSCGNFLTVEVGDAAAVNAALLRQGIIVRPIANYGLPEWLRISIGTEAENAACIAALERALHR